jgi:hypothetical protein
VLRRAKQNPEKYPWVEDESVASPETAKVPHQAPTRETRRPRPSTLTSKFQLQRRNARRLGARGVGFPPRTPLLMHALIGNGKPLRQASRSRRGSAMATSTARGGAPRPPRQQGIRYSVPVAPVRSDADR